MGQVGANYKAKYRLPAIVLASDILDRYTMPVFDPAVGENKESTATLPKIKEAITVKRPIKQQSDFGVCVNDVISLKTNIVYEIQDTFTFTCTLDSPEGAIIHFKSSNLLSHFMIYAGTGNAFTGTPRRMTFERIIVASATAGTTLFGVSGTTALRSTMRWDGALFTGFENLGTITDMLTFAAFDVDFTNYSVGLTINNTVGSPDFIWNGGRIGNDTLNTDANTAITFTGITSLININNASLRLNNNQKAFKFDNALTIEDSVIISDCPINLGLGGSLLDSTGKGKDDIQIQVRNNGDSPDSITAGTASMRANGTPTIITADTRIKIAGTTTAGFLERVTHTTNKLTYTGLETITARVYAEIRITFASNLQAETINLYVVKNGVSASPVANDESTLNGVFNNPTSPYLRAVDLVGGVETDDFFEAFIESDGNDDIVVESLNISFEKVGG